MPSKSCPKCTGSMAQGFIADRTHGGTAVPSWVEGTPERSIWVGVKLEGRLQIEIETWRCGRCGFLEQYAAGGPSRQLENRKQIQRVALIVAAVTAALVAGILVLLRP